MCGGLWTDACTATPPHLPRAHQSPGRTGHPVCESGRVGEEGQALFRLQGQLWGAKFHDPLLVPTSPTPPPTEFLLARPPLRVGWDRPILLCPFMLVAPAGAPERGGWKLHQQPKGDVGVGEAAGRPWCLSPRPLLDSKPKASQVAPRTRPGAPLPPVCTCHVT